MAMYLADLCTIPSDLAGNAAISVPCGLAAEDGLPVGLQVMAPALADDRLYRVAAAVEAAFTGRWGRTAAGPGEGTVSMTMTTDTLVPFAEAVERYEPVIGLETHVELGTRTKMFCGCPTTFGAEPNSQVCPVCLGLPGSLPVTNRTAIEYTIRIGLALNCSIATLVPVRAEELLLPGHAEGLPDLPVRRAAVHRRLAGRGRRRHGTVRVGIERVHLEEDTGKSLHVGGATGRIHGAEYSLVDYNRAGIPLVEIVTKPVDGTGAAAPEVARAYVTELRDLLRALGVSDVRMEEGSLRCDVNTSLSPRGSGRGGPGPRPRTSTRCVRWSGPSGSRSSGRPPCSTPAAGSSRRPGTSTRTPAPRRPAGPRKRPRTTGTSPSPTWCRWPRPPNGWRRSGPRCPRRPSARRARLQAEWDLSETELTALSNAGALDLVADTVAAGASPSDARKWWLGELARRANDEGVELAGLPITPAQVARVAQLVSAGTLNDRLARDVIDAVLAGEGDPIRWWPPAAWPWSATRARSPPPSTRRSRPTPMSPPGSATARSPRPAPWSARS